MVLSGAALGFLVGLFPTVAMLLASILLAKFEVEPKIEACFQNFCAGLMIAAVASELFPLVLEDNRDIEGDTRDVRVLGVFIGFVLGFGIIHSVEFIINSFENDDSHSSLSKSDLKELQDIQEMETTMNTLILLKSNDLDSNLFHEDGSILDNNIQLSDKIVGPMDKKRYEGLFEAEDVLKSTEVIVKNVSHREHIIIHLRELLESIETMRLNTERLQIVRTPSLDSHHNTPDIYNNNIVVVNNNNTNNNNTNLIVNNSESLQIPLDLVHDHSHHSHEHKLHTHIYRQNVQAEQLAETIDEEIHKLQYKLDHCRRLLQGSECGVFHGPSWLNSEKIDDVKIHIEELKTSVDHLLKHMDDTNFDINVLQEIYTHMDDMDSQLARFHETMTHHTNKWRRSRPFPEVIKGESIPTGLIIPVCIDSFVDGFLIGVTVSVSFKAGLILSLANCLEMGFLGMAYTTRVMKCTGSSFNIRIIAIIVPPIIMFLGAGIGGALGLVSQANPTAFIAFVSFGIIAILFLVCNELLIEAKELQGDEPKWWINATLFLGIYIVIIMDHYI